jgi:hypothetical protein
MNPYKKEYVIISDKGGQLSKKEWDDLLLILNCEWGFDKKFPAKTMHRFIHIYPTKATWGETTYNEVKEMGISYSNYMKMENRQTKLEKLGI